MKIYGYKRRTVNAGGLMELSEATFCCSPQALRHIAAFLLQSARNMMKYGKDFGHAHLCDYDKCWSRKRPDVIVAVIARRKKKPQRRSMAKSSAKACP